MAIDDCIRESMHHIRDAWFFIGFNRYDLVLDEIKKATTRLNDIPTKQRDASYDIMKLKIYHLFNHYHREMSYNK